MKAAPDRAYVQKALRSADAAALALTRVELCHVLAELERVLGAGGPARFVGACFAVGDGPAPDPASDRAGDRTALRYMPLVEGIPEPELKRLPIFEGWKWWDLYARWQLCVGTGRPTEEDAARYRRIVGNREVLEDAGVDDSDILTGAYRFQVDFDADEDWIDEMALCLLCDASEKTVAEVCAREDVETSRPDYARTVIRVAAVRAYLATSPAFVSTTFLDPGDARMTAATAEA
ncbi:MAG: hypothetical protein R3229_11500 [Alphaproteobacteria bacterium]|nr:hypothetical protein [Alphaproteobacteria bacterium]